MTVLKIADLIMNIKTTKSITRSGEELLTFDIPTYTGIIHMCVSERLKDKYIILLNPKKYYNMWKNSPYSAHQKYAHQAKNDWIYDYKYPNICEEMNNTKEKPVHLIEINNAIKIKKRKKIPFSKYFCNWQTVGFEFKDGITRSMWLLLNKAKYIPVVCYDKKTARLMSKYGSHNNSKVYNYENVQTNTGY